MAAIKKKSVSPISTEYMAGLGNYFASEAEEGALPLEQNSPQEVPYGLYAEQISGTSFNTARANNKYIWLYKIRPSVTDRIFKPKSQSNLSGCPFVSIASPNPLRWLPFAMPQVKTDFVSGLFTVAGNGDINTARGCAVHIYRANSSMEDTAFVNNDGEFLFVPEMGAMRIVTELGELVLKPGEICVIPTGIKFKIELIDKEIRGYILENYGSYLRLPELGAIGANGLANPRHFLSPQAKYENRRGSFELIMKFQNKLWSSISEYSPFDIVAWHGNYVPYKYDLNLFQVINSVSFDHVDPSIYTVLTAPSEIAGLANVDLVVFPPRWSVSEHTFRPPYFHRNCMSELMGLIKGQYEARSERFAPGGLALHNRFTAHGPDVKTYEKAIAEELKPQKLDDGLAFMFESSLVFQPTEQAMKNGNLDSEYLSVWQGFNDKFKH